MIGEGNKPANGDIGIRGAKKATEAATVEGQYKQDDNQIEHGKKAAEAAKFNIGVVTAMQVNSLIVRSQAVYYRTLYDLVDQNPKGSCKSAQDLKSEFSRLLDWSAFTVLSLVWKDTSEAITQDDLEEAGIKRVYDDNDGDVTRARIGRLLKKLDIQDQTETKCAQCAFRYIESAITFGLVTVSVDERANYKPLIATPLLDSLMLKVGNDLGLVLASVLPEDDRRY